MKKQNQIMRPAIRIIGHDLSKFPSRDFPLLPAGLATFWPSLNALLCWAIWASAARGCEQQFLLDNLAAGATAAAAAAETIKI